MQTDNGRGKSIFLLFSHRLTDEQIKELKDNNITQFIYLPDSLQLLWSNVPPDKESVREIAKVFFDWLRDNAQRGDWVLVQGDAGVCFLVVEFCFENGFVPVYATTRRRVVEKRENGRLIKVSEFKHERFRRYERYKN